MSKKKKQVDTRKGRHLTRKKEYEAYYVANKDRILEQQKMHRVSKMVKEIIFNNNQEKT